MFLNLFPGFAAIDAVLCNDLRASSLRMDPTPPMDAYVRDGKAYVHLDLPGVAREGLTIDTENGWIVVSAERSYAPEPGDTVYVSERPFGKFERRFRLGHHVDPSSVTADLHDGVLTLSYAVDTAPRRARISLNDPSAAES